MLDDIMLIYDKNFGRLNNLITLYSSISTGKGRKPASNLDLLRATVVLTHSTLEDFLRSLLSWKLPGAGRAQIDQIPLAGTSATGRKAKFELGDLLPYRANTVDQIIHLSVKEYLDTQSFNNTTDVAKALTDCSLVVNARITATFPNLNEMIKRRHNIVHQADRDLTPGRGHHAIKSISLKQVDIWKTALDNFAKEVINQL